MKLNLSVLAKNITIYKLGSVNGLSIPSQASFFTLTITDDEYSVMSDVHLELNSISSSSDWKAIKVVGDLPFDIVGVTSNLCLSLANNCIGIMAVCTHDRDFILVKNKDLDRAKEALLNSGHTFV